MIVWKTYHDINKTALYCRRPCPWGTSDWKPISTESIPDKIANHLIAGGWGAFHNLITDHIELTDQASRLGHWYGQETNNG